MATWQEFEAQAPEMAVTGHKLIYQFGMGLGFLATVRKDGGPRLHPFCPILAGGGMYGLIAPSPKRHDLLRDGRFAFHSFPPEKVDDEFYCTGTVKHIDNAEIRALVLEKYKSSGGSSSDDELLFEFHLERALLAVYRGRNFPEDWPPAYTKWVES